MRKATAGLLLATGCGFGLTSCAPALRNRLSPDLPEFRLAILVRRVEGRCRTTTIPALALATSRQTITWEVMSFDPAACKPADVMIATKGRTPPPTGAAAATASTSRPPTDDKGRELTPVRGERGDTWSVRNLRPGRYKYDVRIGAETEDPELEIWR